MNIEEMMKAYKGIPAETRAELLKSARPVPVALVAEIEKGHVNIEKRQVTTAPMQAWEPDLHGQRILPDEIEAAFDSYMASWQVIGRMHSEITNSYPVRAESWGSLGVMTIQVVDDEDWLNIVNGVYKGTSWGGMAMVVTINEELGDALMIPAGEWLFDIEWMENSFVDYPAVQSATFKAADEVIKADTLVQQLLAGTVKPRVKPPKMKPPRPEPGAPGDTVAGGKSGGLLQMLRGLAETIKSLLTAADGGEETTTEDTDMGMTPEEIARLENVEKGIGDIGSKLDQLVNAGKGGDNPDPESTEEEAAKVEETKAEDGAEVIEGDELEKALAPLREQIEQLTADKASLETAIEELKAKPGPSAKLLDEGDGKDELKGPAISSLEWNHPDRQKALNPGR